MIGIQLNHYTKEKNLSDLFGFPRSSARTRQSLADSNEFTPFKQSPRFKHTTSEQTPNFPSS